MMSRLRRREDVPDAASYRVDRPERPGNKGEEERKRKKKMNEQKQK